MKRVIIVIMIVFIAIDLAILLGIPRAQTFVAASGVTPAIPASSAVPLPSRCPSIDEAINALKTAQRDLHEARHDFCGHKLSAIEATDRAVSELRAAESCANCR
jgi:hypothetical protein